MRIWIGLLLAASTPALGCADIMPRWTAPGTQQDQQRWAARFDPYPSPELGPTVVGGRPREFQNPVAESENAHAFAPNQIRPPQAVSPAPAVRPRPLPPLPLR